MTINIRNIFEVHLAVEDRRRSVNFYQEVLNFALAADIERRDISFLWMGAPGTRMLGLWGPKCPDSPISRGKGHFAMELTVDEIISSLLPDVPRPELGVVGLGEWRKIA